MNHIYLGIIIILQLILPGFTGTQDNNSQNELIYPEPLVTGVFHYGVAKVWLDDGWPTGRRGVINRQGQWVFGPVPQGVSISNPRKFHRL